MVFPECALTTPRGSKKEDHLLLLACVLDVFDLDLLLVSHLFEEISKVRNTFLLLTKEHLLRGVEGKAYINREL